MRVHLLVAAAAMTVLAAPVTATQVPARPSQYPTEPPKPLPAPKSVHRDCGGRAGCTFYKVSLSSTMTIEDTEIEGITSTIKGQGSIVFGLGPDNAEAGYDFTSGVDDLTAPVYWERDSALITRPSCIVTTVELPYTMFAFWLGITNSPTLKLGVRITPAGDEMHSVATRCKDPLGKWHDGPPEEKASIFTPAWIRMHGEGKIAAPQSADQQELIKYTNQLGKGGNPAPPKVNSPAGGAIDMNKLMAMDPAKLAAMAEKMDPNNPADMAKLQALMTGVVPNADQQLAAAMDNFMFTVPGECAAVNAIKTVCRLPSTPVTMKDRLGFGTIKKITEQTTITIEKVTPPAGS